ncbi:Coiled-coil domain-containing protein 81 [Stylophora pistillata]|uniref:Coiled-coil domain-containing protein 81 n=1 Tax=Stylophora pistillata TaxID=50429 RepID=A0A2B4SXJ8_STYPI|nr:Coiled-coil domain-containing protein 81 [Stylophora pistillata]
MAEVMYGLVSEARKNRFSAIPKLTGEDIVSVWDNVSRFIEKQMALQKGVCVPGLGIFTFSQKKLDVGNNKYIQIQRPVFMLSEKFAMTHALNYAKHHTTGQIPVVQLNFAALSNETPFNRDTVESCVKEVLQALSRSVQAKRNVEFHFSGIGRLSIRDSKVKMKFYKEFLKSMDGSGSLVQAMSNRPGTADSVLSEPVSPRPHTSNTLVLPRITPGESGSPGKSAGKEGMPTITEQDEEDNGQGEDVREEVTTSDKEMPQEQVEGGSVPVMEPQLGKQEQPTEEEAVPKSASRLSPPTGPRSPLQTAKVSGVIYSTPEASLTLPPPPPPPLPPPRSPSKTNPSRGIRGATVYKNTRSPAQEATKREQSPTECIHSERAGQELCYLCHQRSQKNIPIYFAEERRQRELEQDRLLQQYQEQKDAETILKDQGKTLENRRYNQKVAAFNLGVSEAIKEKLSTRPTEFSVRFKPLPIPALEPDSKIPIFGILDATEEKLLERKTRAHQLYQEQLEMVAQRKRDAILKDLRNQKEESDMLERTRRDMILDRAFRHQERVDVRRSLEDSWAASVCRKKDQEHEERRRTQSPGMLIHEQCDKYHRCKQCGRRPSNCGESNVWSDSRYMPGSRLIV